jgi:hypothetical protein
MQNYFSHPDHGYVLDGLCFGFTVVEKGDDDVELQIMGNNNNPASFAMMPEQVKPAASPVESEPQLSAYKQYAYDGVVAMQSITANTVLKRKSGKNDASITAVLSPFKDDGVWTDTFSVIMEKTVHYICLLAFIPLLFRQVYRVVSEKENRAKEVMFMMNLDQKVYWFSWYAWWTVSNLIMCVGMTSILVFGNAFPNTNWTLLFTIFFVYGQAIFAYMIIAQTLFYKSL